MDHYSNYSGDDKRRNILFYLGVAGVFLAVCITAGCFLFRTPIGATDDAHSYSGIIYDENAVEGGWESLSEEEIADALNSKVEEGMINISMNTSPFFSSGVVSPTDHHWSEHRKLPDQCRNTVWSYRWKW